MNVRQQMLWVFFSFSGRLGPAPFFLAGLLVFIAQGWLLYIAPAHSLDTFMPGAPADPAGQVWTPAGETWAAAFGVFSIVEIWIYVALTAKRLHDFGKPTVLALIAIPLGFFLLAVLPFFKGDAGPNKYGGRTNEPGQAGPEPR